MLSIKCHMLHNAVHFLFGHPCLLFSQALAIIAFNDGKLNLTTFKRVLSIGPTFAIMNFLESKLLHYVMLFCPCCPNSLISYFSSLPCLLVFFNEAYCLLCRLFGCASNVWGLYYCPRHGYIKACYQVLLVWLELRVCAFCLPVSVYSSLGCFNAYITCLCNNMVSGNFWRK